MPTTTTRLRVRYAETDQMGVAYYANYLVWFEVARTDFLRHFGWTYREMEAGGVFLPVIEAHCEYKRPARYDDELVVETSGRLVSKVRLTFEYVVTVAGQADVVATGYTAHAATDPAGKPCRLPARVHEVFA
jgi:acyl-CoA thioester hydrolase